MVCGPAGTGKTFLLEALGQQAVEAGMHVAWFTLESLGVLVRRHRADDTVTKAITRILRADLVVVDLCRSRDYADKFDVDHGIHSCGGIISLFWIWLLDIVPLAG